MQLKREMGASDGEDGHVPSYRLPAYPKVPCGHLLTRSSGRPRTRISSAFLIRTGRSKRQQGISTGTQLRGPRGEWRSITALARENGFVEEFCRKESCRIGSGRSSSLVLPQELSFF